jgi:hypothetical protein
MEEGMTRADIERGVSGDAVNGPALASFLGAGIGAFAMGAVVVAGEIGLFAAPTLYGPAGGVSGRTTVAVVIWLAAWGALHRQWRHRQIQVWPVSAATTVLTALGILGTFPPVWGLI